MSGGFIIPSGLSPAHTKEETVQSQADVKPKLVDESQPLLKLTPRQEGRLRAHLDGKLGELERDSKTQ